MAFRAFIAIEMEDTKNLSDLHRDLMNVGQGLKPVDLDQVHVTLKFLGDVAEDLVPKIQSAMESAVEGISPFQYRLRGAGSFPPRGPAKVIWVGMEDAEPMSRIAERLEEGLEPLGFAREDRPFRPHVTLARVKAPSAAFAAKQVADRYRSADFGPRNVDSIKLKKSVLTRYGPEYSTVLSVPLH